MQRTQRTLTLSVTVAGFLLIAGCSSGEEDLPDPTFAEQASTTAADDDEFEDVDPDGFMLDGRVVFDNRTGDEGTGVCLIGTDENDGDAVTCTGTAPGGAPDIEVPPFRPQRPGAVTITAEGITYTMVEGVRPAPGKLEPGQRITEGDASCEMSDDSELNCTVGETSLTLSGDDRTMALTGEVLDHEYHLDPDASSPTAGQDDAPAGIDGDYSETDEPVSAGTTCGAASGRTLVEVREGAVSCLEAQRVIDDYRERRYAEGGGNSLAMMLGEWDCSSPTAGRAAQLDAAEICHGPDDTVIATPAGSGQP